MLADLVDLLRCPVCGVALAYDGGVVSCAADHSFDIARQGYVSLFAGGGRTGEADTPAMVEARDAFLRAGHYRRLSDELAKEARAPTETGSAVIDLPRRS